MSAWANRSTICCRSSLRTSWHPSLTDMNHLEEALELAARGWGATSPNPAVGAVVVRDGEVVGRGYHTWAGMKHAEVLALEEAQDRARGGTLYVTLEPCASHGRTPPCIDAILASGVSKVVAPME